MPKPSHEGSASRGPFVRNLLVVLAALAVGASVLGFLIRDGTFWGAEAYAGYPARVLALAALGLSGTAILALMRMNTPVDEAALAAGDAASSGLPHAARPEFLIVLAALGAGTFWLARSAHLFLGDGISIATTLPGDQRFHPLEPLSMWIEQLAFAASMRIPGWAAAEPWRAAWRSSALVSVLAGAVFLPALWALASRLEEFLPAAARGRRTLLTALIFGVLATQGYIQLFFGYVEIYSLSLAALALYLLAAAHFLLRPSPLWPAALALTAAVGLHLSALALVPSFLVLLAIAWLDPERRARRLRDTLLTAVCFAALPLVLFLIGDDSSFVSTVVSLVRTVLGSQPEVAHHYFFSWPHLRDFVNEQFLIGPLALPLFVPAAIAAIVRPASPWRPVAFFIAVGIGMAGVCAIAGDSNLGYARNWDLLAPAGFALAVAGVALLLPRLESPRACAPALALALAISCFTTVPWIGLNASLPRALARFTTLPLGLGRVESTVGDWYAMNGDDREAEKWLVRALNANPANVRAHVFLGDLYARHRDYERAALAYRAAVTLMPDWRDYRLRLVDALVRSGHPDEATPEARHLIEREPTDPRLWSVYAIVLLGAGHIDEAREAFGVARRDAPDNLLYALMLNYADLPSGFERALGDVWGSLIGPTS